MIYNPVSTYRIQFSKDFTLIDLQKVIPYLHELGITTIYASPFFIAVPGSRHGYDVTSPLGINPEIGTLAQFRTIHKKLKSLGMGWIQDIVPNHMAFSLHNPWIMDILENGSYSEYCDFFDIDWNHPDKDLRGKILLPFLGKPLDKAIDCREIYVRWLENRFVLKYYDEAYPLNYRSYLSILGKTKKNQLPHSLSEVIEFIENSVHHKDKASRARAVLSDKYNSDISIRDYIDKNLNTINESKKLLKKLIQIQYYLPVYWKKSRTMLNYRRFFTINGMVCLRMEQKKVFDFYHSFISSLCNEDLIQGLRVDHIDGLYDPAGYLSRLRELAGRHRYIMVEKILEKDEYPEKNWPVQGETGYGFLAEVNNLFTNRDSYTLLKEAYNHWIGNRPETDFNRLAYQKKRFILYQRMAADLDNLFRLFETLSISDPGIYDTDNLKTAIGEFLINCPVYKIYNGPDSFNPHQKEYLEYIFKQSLQTAPACSNEIHLLRMIFLEGGRIYPDKIREINVFFKRCMQYTGPLMAKGGEDTAFYIYNRLIVHNEVGDSPANFGITCEAFHKQMIRRQKETPLSLNATSTHDTKRGEDARARLNVISDIPRLWINEIYKWHILNRRFKETDEDNNEIPTLNDEYFIYQTLIGFLPADEAPDDNFRERLERYITKALREGKTESDWSEPNIAYETLVKNFLSLILSEGSDFIGEIKQLHRKIAFLGVINSVSQLLIKMTAPGVPDIYQGSESWNFSFVDPDNRRPVNFKELKQQLLTIKQENNNTLNNWYNLSKTDLKVRLTYLLLKLRNAEQDLFLKGDYIPLNITGKLNNLVISYAREFNDTIILIALPVHTGSLFDNDNEPDLRSVSWDDTQIQIPDLWPSSFINLLNNKTIKTKKSLYLSEIFADAPFALMKAKKEKSVRYAGILMHVTSLPGKYDTGDFGPEAYRFADFLKDHGQRYWQVLPLNQVYKDGCYSPYSSLSAFAGNIYLISPELLIEQNLVGELKEDNRLHTTLRVNYEKAAKTREMIIDEAFTGFKNMPSGILHKDFTEFCKKEAYWLDDYSLFISLKKKHGMDAWIDWPPEFRERDEKSLELYAKENKDDTEREKFAQFLFMIQWKNLKTYCNSKGIKILGDVPIYVNYDSADVWSYPELFRLDENRMKVAVAGVPPDYFSEKGQLWGMPVFRWDVMRKDGYLWWINRIRKNLELFDLLRLYHFRGFSAFWEVPAGEKTAVKGNWIKGPGARFFNVLLKEFPDMPFIAEDLGDVDQSVYDLRDKYGLPGMRILQFAFGKNYQRSNHIPHNHTYNSVVYTGTHDNNTTKGWFTGEAGKMQRKHLKNYSGRKIHKRNCHWQLIRMAYASVASLVIIPIQDFIGLGSKARMNIPATENNNWLWRLSEKDLTPEIKKKIKNLVKTYGRI